MAREEKKRDWGAGSVVTEKRGLAIRWSETVVDRDGRRRRKMRYEFLGPVTQRKAERTLRDRIVDGRRRDLETEKAPCLVTFKDHADRWERDILPMYKFSVRLSYHSILAKHLVPAFGNCLVARLGVADVQQWITSLRERKLAPHSIHHFQEALRAVMREAVTWYGLDRNPAAAVKMPKLETVRPKFALTPEQAGKLIAAIAAPKVKTMVALAIVTSLRRGELLALRWGSVDEAKAVVHVSEASYAGHLDTPKTKAGIRSNGLDPWTLGLLKDWKAQSKRTKPDDFVFGTRTGKLDNAMNILHRHVYPACGAAGIPRSNFLTFRRTFSTEAHRHGIPPKTIAAIMGHANVDTQFIYIQELPDAMKQVAAGRIGEELSRFCPDTEQLRLPLIAEGRG